MSFTVIIITVLQNRKSYFNALCRTNKHLVSLPLYIKNSDIICCQNQLKNCHVLTKQDLLLKQSRHVTSFFKGVAGSFKNSLQAKKKRLLPKIMKKNPNPLKWGVERSIHITSISLFSPQYFHASPQKGVGRAAQLKFTLLLCKLRKWFAAISIPPMLRAYKAWC